jgi:uncharacterized protein YgiM (DUF1202 family)
LKRTRLEAAPRLGRRGVLRASAGAAVGLLLGGGVPNNRRASAQQGGSILGGRWIEAEGFGLEQNTDPSQYIAFAPDFPVYAVAPSWSGEGDPCGSVELLWSADGVSWSDPVWIGRSWHGGMPDRDGRNIGTLVALPGASFLQYRTSDSAGNLVSLPGFEIDYIDATAGPTLEQVAAPATNPVFGPPPVISRAAWGADESLRYGKNGNETWPVAYQAVEHVIIHHADTANFNDPVLEMRSIYYYHCITHGWGDIGYNYLLDFMGNVYEGRVGGETAVGGHAAGYNTGSCGICLMGRYFEDDTTPEMHTGLDWIVSWAARDLDPEGRADFYDIPSLPTICGHRDVNPTTCPGDEFYGQLDAVRNEVRRVINGRDDPEPPPPEWWPGMRVVTNEDGTKLRKAPGLEFDVVATVPLGEPFTIVEGPASNDGLIWYHVQGSSLEGWIAGSLLSRDPKAIPSSTPATGETNPPPDAASPPADSDAAEPVGTPVEMPPDASADDGDTGDDGGGKGGQNDGGGKGGQNDNGKERRQEDWSAFAIGASAVVMSGPLNLRVEPGLAGTILTALPDGYMATILDGPVDVDGVAWYQVVTADGVDGWCDGSFLQPA